MERIRNNEPSTPDSSNKTIEISYDSEIQSEPNPTTEPEEFDDLVR